MNIKELDLLEDSKLRDKLIGRTEVLEKVGELLLLPNIEFATTEQVAKYYGVDSASIRKIANRNNDELKIDGVKYLKGNEIKAIYDARDNMSQVSKSININAVRGGILVDGNKVAYSSNALFPRRAILRVGMLLRDSEVAKEIRTYLLNIEEGATQEQKDDELERLCTEDKILVKLINAKDKLDLAVKLNEYKIYKDSQIHKLEIKNEALVDGIVKWDKRDAVNRMIRKIAYKIFKNKGGYKYAAAYDKLKAEMLYKHGIHITRRLKSLNKKNATMFDVLDDGELSLAVKSSVTLCEMYKIDTDDILYG